MTRSRPSWLALGCALLCYPALAQPERYEGRTIRAIEYVPQQQPLSLDDLSTFQPLKVGSPLRQEDVQAAIDKLFSTGEFEDIQVDVAPRDDGVAVRFITKNRTFIGHISVEGKISDPPNAGQILDATQLRLGQPLESKDLAESDTAVQDLFRRNGLYDATVSHRLVPEPQSQQMAIVFDVKSGKRAKFDTPVITGDPKLPEKDIAKATGWRRFLIGGWKPVTAIRVRNGLSGVQKKYQSKDRLMAKVQLKSLDYDATTRRVKPTLDINGGPKVKVRSVEAKVSKRTLKKYLPIYQEQSVDRDLLVEGARNLRDYFQSQGFYEAEIDFREAPQTDPDEMLIEYIIAKGARHKLVHVEIKGNKYFKEDDIRERLILRTASFPAFRHGRYSEAYRQRDAEEIANLYKANGFREVKVTSAVQDDYNGKAGDIGVTYEIAEGSQWRIGNLDINGMSPQATAAVASKLSSSPGQPFSEVNVAADRKTILDYYFSNGYPSAQFRWKNTETGPNAVDVQYTVTEGSQRFVRDVLISGLQTTRKRLVDHALGIHKGDPLAPIAVTNTQHQLYNLGVFAKVQAALQDPEGATTNKYVLYDFQEASRYTVRLGVGADVSRFGPTTSNLSTPNNSTGFSPRFSVDVSRLNLFGIGHTVSVQGRVSSFEQRLLFNYYAPRFQNIEGRNITFSTLYDYSRDVRTFTAKREEASIQVSQTFTKAVSGLFRFAYRRVSTANVVIPTLLVPQLLQPVRIGILSANFVQDRRDNPASTTHGIYNTIDMGVAYRAFGSQRNFIRGLGRNATYYRIGKHLVLARELTFGLIIPFSNAKNLTGDNVVPLPERFFGGGGQSLRAFPENQAGPRDIGTPAGPGAPATQPTGFPLGGNALLAHQTELRFPLLGENIGGVFFHDMGNIFDKFSNISFRMRQRNLQDFNYLVHAAGFGIRYKTPVGPVRVDLAYSINPPSYVGFKGTFQQLLQCNPNGTNNPSFCTGVPQNVGHFQFFFSIGQTF